MWLASRRLFNREAAELLAGAPADLQEVNDRTRMRMMMQ
jgi:hypothetical protein